MQKLNKEEVKNKIERLKETIDYHRYLYHVEDRQEISEQALDSLKHELWLLEQDYPEFVTKDSPTQRVEGEPLGKFEKVKHIVRMLSLNDVFDYEELQDWEDRLKKVMPGYDSEYYAEVKMDGLAVSLIYDQGILSIAATRGNGLVGENVTQNIRTIESIPLKLRLGQLDERQKLLVQGRVEVRGEIYMLKSEFERVNKRQEREGLEIYANPRNLAAGTIRQLDSKVVAQRKLDFMSYDLVTDLGQKTHSEAHELLEKIGFPSNRLNRKCSSLEDVREYYVDVVKKRDNLPYQIDGVVVSVDNVFYYEKLGIVGKAPRYMIAYKFPAEQVTTKVVDVEVQVGRTGALTPVAILEPVSVAGTVVSRATLHNEDEIKRKDVRIGDTVVIHKAGDIIPEVVSTLPKMRSGEEKKFEFPQECPVCGGNLERKEGEKVVRCVSDDCFAQIQRNISHFVSKSGFDIEGMGKKIVEQLINNGLINNVAEIFELKVGDLEPLERFAEKSANNLVDSIENSKEISLDRFLYALGIRHVGQQTAYDLAKYFKTIVNFLKAEKDELADIEGIGEVVADSIEEFLSDQKKIDLVRKLLDLGVVVESMQSENKLENKSFVITGRLIENSRDSLKMLIKNNGGRVSSSVSAKTDYLIAGEKAGSKLKRARELGVEIIDEKRFLDMIK